MAELVKDKDCWVVIISKKERNAYLRIITYYDRSMFRVTTIDSKPAISFSSLETAKEFKKKIEQDD